jgi:septum formation protein
VFTLASESGRRVDLLRCAGYDFDTRRSGFPEVTLEDPKETVMSNARGKALAVVDGNGGVVLGADTVVYLSYPSAGVLGQAKDAHDVRWMLGLLEGTTHEVHSGVAVVRSDELAVRHAVTKVRMRGLQVEAIEAYARLGEGVGKAGGYAIQGRAAAFVEWIGGNYTNVVGLPLALTCRMLASVDVHPF